ncbi:hypothetical protein F5Y03DRAFT_400758 [Xylaria venustula]|nr:hypothetical protein F5Y03DRAFT_400758 [Xylaria venustula]
MSTQSLPRLPTELYVRIIELVDDELYLPNVWLNFCLVSREFKALTELAFVREHLPETLIYFPVMHDVIYGADEQKHYSGLCLRFEKLTGKKRRACSLQRAPRRISVLGQGLA